MKTKFLNNSIFAILSALAAVIAFDYEDWSAITKFIGDGYGYVNYTEFYVYGSAATTFIYLFLAFIASKFHKAGKMRILTSPLFDILKRLSTIPSKLYGSLAFFTFCAALLTFRYPEAFGGNTFGILYVVVAFIWIWGKTFFDSTVDRANRLLMQCSSK